MPCIGDGEDRLQGKSMLGERPGVKATNSKNSWEQLWGDTTWGLSPECVVSRIGKVL